MGVSKGNRSVSHMGSQRAETLPLVSLPCLDIPTLRTPLYTFVVAKVHWKQIECLESGLM